MRGWTRSAARATSCYLPPATEDAEDEEEEVDEVEVQLDRGDDVIVVPEALADCEVKNARECQGGP